MNKQAFIEGYMSKEAEDPVADDPIPPLAWGVYTGDSRWPFARTGLEDGEEFIQPKPALLREALIQRGLKYALLGKRDWMSPQEIAEWSKRTGVKVQEGTPGYTPQNDTIACQEFGSNRPDFYHEYAHREDPEVKASTRRILADKVSPEMIQKIYANEELPAMLTEESARQQLAEFPADSLLRQQLQKYLPFKGTIKDAPTIKNFMQSIRGVPGAQMQLKNPYAYGAKVSPEAQAKKMGVAYQSYLQYLRRMSTLGFPASAAKVQWGVTPPGELPAYNPKADAKGSRRDLAPTIADVLKEQEPKQEQVRAEKLQ